MWCLCPFVDSLLLPLSHCLLLSFAFALLPFPVFCLLPGAFDFCSVLTSTLQHKQANKQRVPKQALALYFKLLVTKMAAS